MFIAFVFNVIDVIVRFHHFIFNCGCVEHLAEKMPKM